MFRYFRDWNRFERRDRSIPLELNYFDPEKETWKSMPNVEWRERVPMPCIALVRHALPRLVRDSRLCDRMALTREHIFSGS
jgi:hypothetical protein